MALLIPDNAPDYWTSRHDMQTIPPATLLLARNHPLHFAAQKKTATRQR